MANTQLFKNTNRNIHRKRYMTSEDSFSKGMQFTDNPLSDEYAKAIVNFDLKNDGESLIPRGGLHNIDDNIINFLYPDEEGSVLDVSIHHTGSMYVETFDETNAVLCDYYLIGCEFISRALGGASVFLLKNTKLVIKAPDTDMFVVATRLDTETSIPGSYNLVRRNRCSLQNFLISEASFGRDGVWTSVNGNTYLLCNKLTGSTLTSKIATIKAKFGETPGSFTWTLEEIEKKDIQPAQAINYGYNMLKGNPYTFANTTSATGAIQLTGVVPYDEQGNLLLTARPGTPIVFKLFYKYPSADATDKYLVQWEIQDLNNSSDATIIKKVRNSTEYTPGSDISIAYTPSFKAFSIIVRLYKKSEITAQDAAWEADQTLQKLVTKDENLTPNQVTTLASYYLTSNSDTSMLNVRAVDFNLATATGMCEWQQRMVLWGVEGAESTLFVSEINDPTYFPYPNNCEIFTSNIVSVIPYLSALLVFTTDALYKITLNDDGLTYKSECVQKRLAMTASDIATVIAVQNMVFFKSENYFYMVVPNSSQNSTTGIQLAPISRMIEQMLDNLPKTFANILNEVYGLAAKDRHTPVQIELIDYWVYTANNQIRNVYKVLATYIKDINTEVNTYFDISLNYDTVLRAWTIYVYQSNKLRDVVYKSTVTGEQQFIHLYNTSATQTNTRLIKVDVQNPSDDIELGYDNDKQYGNWQYINTGYRDFQEDLKKRFREVQFCINTLEATALKFNTAFVVDDINKIPLYKHIVSQCTDPMDSNYGVIFIDRELITPLELPEISQLNAWEFDTAAFPELTVYKIRYKVSGKGYGGAVKILSKNEVPYELLHINWVYRIMFAR